MSRPTAGHSFRTGHFLEHPLQLAFASVDRSSATDERIDDLLAAANSHLGVDNVRALFFGNEAYALALEAEHVDYQLRSLALIVAAIRQGGRPEDATGYIARAIELAPASQNRQLLDQLTDLLGQWAIELEHQPVRRQGRKRDSIRDLAWLGRAITRLDEHRNQLSSLPLVEPDQAMATDPEARRAALGIDDPETGLLNGRGLAAELLQLDNASTPYALVQITVVPDDHPLTDIARIVSMTAEDATVARNARSQITAVLVNTTGMAAMSLAERLKTGLGSIERPSSMTIGIGVAIKQQQETARDVLRRVTDRAEEAAWQSGITVVG